MATASKTSTRRGGDEPQSVKIGLAEDKFSPRERGMRSVCRWRELANLQIFRLWDINGVVGQNVLVGD